MWTYNPISDLRACLDPVDTATYHSRARPSQSLAGTCESAQPLVRTNPSSMSIALLCLPTSFAFIRSLSALQSGAFRLSSEDDRVIATSTRPPAGTLPCVAGIAHQRLAMPESVSPVPAESRV
jgi:hypothetical protein